MTTQQLGPEAAVGADNDAAHGTTVPSMGTTGAAVGDPAERGRTTIADPVVAKIAGMAAREVGGVHDMGGGSSRTLGCGPRAGARRAAERRPRSEGRSRRAAGSDRP